MGNNVGKAIGTAVGAGAMLIPGVGTVAGIAIMAASQTLGAGADAIADANRQNETARRTAEEARRQNEQAVEAQRQAELQRQEAAAAQIRHQQAQLNLIEQVMQFCESGNVNTIPNLLQNMEDAYFYDVLGQRPLAVCNSPDARTQVMNMLRVEEERRNELMAENINGPSFNR